MPKQPALETKAAKSDDRLTIRAKIGDGTSIARACAMPQKLVVIDPGHGGTEANQGSTPFGARGPRGLLEKDVTLALAQRVANRLGGHARTVLTRNADTNPSLGRRAQAASDHGADVFVSLHANSGQGSTRGTEIYVHDEAGGESRALASSVSQALGAYGLPQRGLRSGPMAVLHPGRLGRRPACLVEVEYLSNPEVERRLGNPRELDAIADHLSRGIRSYLEQSSSRERWDGGQYAPGALGPGAGGRYGDGEDGGYFTDADELNAYMRDQRGADTLRVSSVADAQASVRAYLDRGAQTVWPNLDARVVAQQIADRAADFRLFQQGNLNLCGPASFLCIWAGRDPCGYVNYALGLLEHGSGRIGSQTITVSAALEAIPYPRFGRAGLISAPAADFLCMAPLRNSANEIMPYDPGAGAEGLQGMTTPGELAEWLRWTGAFSTVRDEGNWTRAAGIDHALNLMPGTGSDVAMLINVNALASASRVEIVSGGTTSNPVAPDSTFILNMFPNHFVVLLSEVVPDTSNQTVSLTAWTWAGSYVFSGIPVRSFSGNYYGAVKAIMRRD
jgi:N-acetylmuramoyl-L-alanine amidase